MGLMSSAHRLSSDRNESVVVVEGFTDGVLRQMLNTTGDSGHAGVHLLLCHRKLPLNYPNCYKVLR